MSDQKLAERIFDLYELPFRDLQPPQSGYRSRVYAAHTESGQPVCLIIYKAEPGILRRLKNANRIGDLVAAAGLPARATFNPRIVKLASDRHQTYASLYHYLPGQTIAWEAYTMKHIKSLGQSLGLLHHSLKETPRQSLPLATDEYRQIIQEIEAYFSNGGVQQAMRRKLKLEFTTNPLEFKAILNELDKLPAQPLHMDFVRGNILFKADSPEISGILDFEKTAWGPTVFDVARSLAFLLVDCKYKPDHKIKKYFLTSGYHKRGGQPPVDQQLLEQLVNVFLIHDFYKFLAHNPYEFLSFNQHFRRTAAQLLRRGLIRQKLLP